MMNKKELISLIADKVGIDQHSVSGVLREFQYLLLTQLKEDREVILLALGKIKVAKRSARSGINPLTKAPIKIPAKEVPKFSPSKKLKNFVTGTEKDIFSFDY